jgi:hypothetical protein
LWLALNVLRFYTYDADSGRGIHIIVARIQEALLWIEGALFAVVSGWGVYCLYRSGKAGTSRALKIVSWFALSGFCTAWLLLGYSAYCFWRGTHVWQPVFLVLCPSSIVAIGLDGASPLGALIGWLFIAVANTAMYAAIGFALSQVWRAAAPRK